MRVIHASHIAEIVFLAISAAMHMRVSTIAPKALTLPAGVWRCILVRVI